MERSVPCRLTVAPPKAGWAMGDGGCCSRRLLGLDRPRRGCGGIEIVTLAMKS
jgi:hypothetical protein